MRRPDLLNLPSMPPLPQGLELRMMRAEDLDGVADVLTEAFPDTAWSTDRVRAVLLEDPSVKRRYVLLDRGRLVATASCRIAVLEHPGSGYLHWVAVRPGSQGRGLGYIISLACLYAFLELGCADVVLETDDHRLAAIRTYQKLGFQPEPREPSQVERWAQVMANLMAAAGL